MDTIQICDLEVFYRIGVPDEERAKPQRLLITIEMGSDMAACAASDDLSQTIDYYAVCQRLLRFGDDRTWKLLETLASEIAAMILREFRAASVTIEIKKFIIPQTRFVSVNLSRRRLD
jgi:FolB domain-containing protein